MSLKIVYDITEEGRIVYPKIRDFTKIKVWDENGEYTIKVPAIKLNLETFIDHLIVPILKSVGYNDESIYKYVGAE